MTLFENYDLQCPSNMAFAASYKDMYLATAADVVEAVQLVTGDRELADAVKAALHSQQLAMIEKEQQLQAGEQELQASYSNAERYAACLHEVQDTLEEITDAIVSSKRLNKNQLVKVLQQLIVTIDNEL